MICRDKPKPTEPRNSKITPFIFRHLTIAALLCVAVINPLQRFRLLAQWDVLKKPHGYKV